MTCHRVVAGPVRVRSPTVAQLGGLAITETSAGRIASAAGRTLAQDAADRLRSEILTCRLRPGTLISANHLAPEFGISRTPMNEALKLLVAEGLVVVIPRVGYTVTPLTIGDVQEIFEMRLALEPLAAGMAARRATDLQLQALARMWPASPRPLHAPAQPPSIEDAGVLDLMAEWHDRFHLEIARLSGNRRLAETIRGLLDGSRRMLAIYQRRLVQDVAAASRPSFHQAIAAAVVARDREEAVAAMAAHNRQARQDIIAALADEGE